MYIHWFHTLSSYKFTAQYTVLLAQTMFMLTASELFILLCFILSCVVLLMLFTDEKMSKQPILASA